MPIYFDHCYTQDHNHRFLAKLRKKGFTMASHKMEHPGGLLCKFIGFKASSPRKIQYLEFVHTAKGNTPEKIPGVSFAAKGSVERLYHRRKNAKFLRTSFMHRNYDWKKDSKSRLPGWNFVMFKNMGFRSLWPWLTEYEKRPNAKKKPSSDFKHANHVVGIEALKFEVNPAGERFFKTICGKKGDLLRLPCGTRFYFRKARVTRLKYVVLKSRNLKAFIKKYKPDRLIEHEGKPAALIENPNPNMWSVLVV